MQVGSPSKPEKSPTRITTLSSMTAIRMPPTIRMIAPHVKEHHPAVLDPRTAALVKLAGRYMKTIVNIPL